MALRFVQKLIQIDMSVNRNLLIFWCGQFGMDVAIDMVKKIKQEVGQ